MSYEEQLSAAKFRAERDMARQELVIERHRRKLAESAAAERETVRSEDREAARWVRDHGGIECLEEVESMSDLMGRVCNVIGVHDWDYMDRGEFENEVLDELRKRLMPEGCEWPRYESGDLVMFGDRVENRHSTCTVNSVRFYSGGGVTVYGEDDGAQFVVVTEPVMREPIRRAKHRVLAADNEPLEVGQTVWTLDDPSFECVVLGFCNGMVHLKSGADHLLQRDPSLLTHQHPVIAADGRLLREGETVWEVVTGDGYVVERIYSGTTEPDFPGHTVACRRPDDIVTHMFKPSQLTHHRPVLDAGGVPIHEGDTVWFVEDGDYCDVAEISSDGRVRIEYFDGSGSWHDASEFVHHRPVLDAGGVRIKAGDTVRSANTGREYIVSGIFDNNLIKPYEVEAHDVENGDREFLIPDRLTHIKPEIDTWERIEEDAGCTATKYNQRRGTIFTTKQQVARDLVRRARALAGVSE